MATVNINGLDLYYDIKGEGPTLVFAHGIGGNHSNWYQQTAYFSRWYRVVTFDHRGLATPGMLPTAPDEQPLLMT